MTKSFLRWAGGKQWLSRRLGPIIASRLHGGTYCEPFLGSGAMFFATQPRSAVLSDTNRELINTFRQVAEYPVQIKLRLARLKTTKTEYHRLRAQHPHTPIARAVRFIYLNRNCWGGLYRENKNGTFNVPYGGGSRNHKPLVRGSVLELAAKSLRRKGVRLKVCEFHSILSYASTGDVVYCDPTYRRQTRDHFDRYGEDVFDWNDQKNLASLAQQAFERGALVIISNASCFGIAELYPDALILSSSRKKGIGNEHNKAALVEYIFILDPQRRDDEWACVGQVIRPSSRSSRTVNDFHCVGKSLVAGWT